MNKPDKPDVAKVVIQFEIDRPFESEDKDSYLVREAQEAVTKLLKSTTFDHYRLAEFHNQNLFGEYKRKE